MIGFVFVAISLCALQPHPAEGNDLIDKRTCAALGNSDIALELFEHYMDNHSEVDSIFWLRVAAEQGNCKGMIEYSRMLGAGMQKKDEQAFWVKRAEDMGCDISEVRYTPEPRS